MAIDSLEASHPIQKTSTSCAAAATAYVCTHVAIHSGVYVPDLERLVIRALGLDKHGAALHHVALVLNSLRDDLARIGAGTLGWSLASVPTERLIDWVRAGFGTRGAVLGVDVAVLYPGQPASPHAVALAFTTIAATGSRGVALVDPWPGFPDESLPPPTLDAARRVFAHEALLVQMGT